MSKEMKIKPNNLDVALSSIKYDVDLPTEINEAEKGFYHVAIITRILIHEEERYDTSVAIQKFHPEVYNRYKGDGFSRAGIKHMYIFHDPTKKAARKTVRKSAEDKTEELS